MCTVLRAFSSYFCNSYWRCCWCCSFYFSQQTKWKCFSNESAAAMARTNKNLCMWKYSDIFCEHFWSKALYRVFAENAWVSENMRTVELILLLFTWTRLSFRSLYSTKTTVLTFWCLFMCAVWSRCHSACDLYCVCAPIVCCLAQLLLSDVLNFFDYFLFVFQEVLANILCYVYLLAPSLCVCVRTVSTLTLQYYTCLVCHSIYFDSSLACVSETKTVSLNLAEFHGIEFTVQQSIKAVPLSNLRMRTYKIAMLQSQSERAFRLLSA